MPDDPSTKQNASAMAAWEWAPIGMAIMRLGLGTMFLYVFFENLSKGLYGKEGYSGLINYYIEKGQCPRLLEEHHELYGQPRRHRWSATGSHRNWHWDLLVIRTADSTSRIGSLSLFDFIVGL